MRQGPKLRRYRGIWTGENNENLNGLIRSHDQVLNHVAPRYEVAVLTSRLFKILTLTHNT